MGGTACRRRSGTLQPYGRSTKIMHFFLFGIELFLFHHVLSCSSSSPIFVLLVFCQPGLNRDDLLGRKIFLNRKPKIKDDSVAPPP